MNQPGLRSNQVHLALFFRIAELFPQDDELVGGYDNRNENDSMRDIHLP